MKAALVIFALIAAPAGAQTLDAGAAHRADMERLRALSDTHAASAAAFRTNAQIAARQLQASTRTDPAAHMTETELRAEARRQEDLRRRAEQDTALELERRLRNVGSTTSP